MIEILSYISAISGTLLTVMILLNLFSGLDTEIEVDGLDTDFGVVKSILSFLSIGGLAGSMLLSDGWSLIGAIFTSVLVGVVAVVLLTFLFKALLKNQANVNWNLDDAVGKTGKVYLRIPPKGSGLVMIHIKGTEREVMAYSTTDEEIPTGSEVLVVSAGEAHVLVQPMKNE
jgi:membrane protein implicated in regulation of membrane protease activity